ncbi:FISUMP domain-containing protein [Dysgonomonas sp. 25]|uniref:FISUMP domain-containing protein n=1 Tax=Dysgonomonas sp. 25 TaxID=2302933 RepID=UPI0013D5F402|nr:FISUMP domain-containing protein [Dysgonomonas sp. 25]NDV68870.1 hypothetical protein [Dysgonomonas sp. 25]
MKQKTLIQAIIILALFTTISLQAQVTIGSSEAPAQGALLDLKESGTTTKGLGMPRVELNNLTPTNNTEFSTSIGGSGNWSMTDHVGLIVYNSKDKAKCPVTESIYKGLYVWDGNKWEGIGIKKPEVPLAPTNESEWGTQVLRHPAKAGVYEEFISASFGTTGRWMVTNLAASAYDGIHHSTYGTINERTLIGPDGNMGGAYNMAAWCYPSSTSPTTSTEYEANPHIGYLYTWDAATAGKGGVDGLQNVVDEQGLIHPEVQGICPAGWHLPSDREWTDLENEIIRNTTKYANVANNIDPGDNSQIIPYLQSGIRGAHGYAMTEACEGAATGTSKAYWEGGFSGLLVGYGYAQGSISYIWTSSSANMATYAQQHTLGDGWSGVGSFSFERKDMLPIRCKKN